MTRRKGAAAARPEVRAFQAYTLSPQELPELRAKLDFNESPFDVPAALKETVLSRLSKRRWADYPEFGASRLTAALSRATGRPAAEIVVGNGSGELLMAAISVFAGGGTLLLSPPTFSLYRQLAVLSGARLREVPRRPPDFALDEAAFLQAASEGAVPLVCSPNNPTGGTVSQRFVKELAGLSGVVLADQAYVDFGEKEDDVLPLVDEVENLIVFRTLSKAYSAAGFRIGYAVARADVATELRKAVLPFSVDLAAEELAVALLDAPEFSRRSVETVRSNREGLAGALRALGAAVAPSRANFLFFAFPGRDGKRIASALARRGVLVRELSSAAEGYLRVTVGGSDENRIFLEALKESL